MIRKAKIAAIFVGVTCFGLVGAMTMTAGASSSVVVNPANQQGWSTADTRPGGAVSFVTDATTPQGRGALQLTTNETTTAKAQYLHAANTSLSSIVSLSYYTEQVSGTPVADPAYQVLTYLNGGTSGYSTLVFEPYQNTAQGLIVPNAWQKWDVGAGLFWSTRTVTCSNGTVTGSAGGPAKYTLAQIETLCPNALVIGYGVNVGSNNPSYVVRTDLFEFNGTIYDFEPGPSSKDDCKNGGWMTFTDPAFTNQGQCVSTVARP